MAAFMVYIHDCGLFDDSDGFGGFSTMRVGVFMTSIYLLALFLGIRAFIESRGKIYRVAYLVPIVMLAYQLFVHILNAREETVNEFNTKVVFHTLIVPALILGAYFVGKKNRWNER